jgi:predicted acylesterase/phospholipase RssA
MQTSAKKTLGLALSGSGNRSTFYIGFLEGLEESGIKPDYIAASSGGSLVAAAYACGTLPEFKERILSMTKETLRTYLVKSSGGGLFGLGLLEEEIRKYTKGLRFEEVRPLMGFVAVDIENGEKVLMSMGDIAHAACVSCALPGVFDPEKWGGKTLIDGGLLITVPTEYLKLAGMDISVGINMRGTRHIFTQKQLTARRIYNFIKKIFFIDEFNEFFDNWPPVFDADIQHKPKLFSVIGKSLDLAIAANKIDDHAEELCDLMITPDIPTFKRNSFTSESLKFYSEAGRKAAKQYAPVIWELMQKKEKVSQS